MKRNFGSQKLQRGVTPAGFNVKKSWPLPSKGPPGFWCSGRANGASGHICPTRAPGCFCFFSSVGEIKGLRISKGQLKDEIKIKDKIISALEKNDKKAEKLAMEELKKLRKIIRDKGEKKRPRIRNRAIPL